MTPCAHSSLRAFRFFARAEMHISQADDDGSGKIEFEEFVHMMRKNKQSIPSTGSVPASSSGLNPKAAKDISALLVNISSQIETLARNQDAILRRIVRVEEQVHSHGRKNSASAEGVDNIPGKVTSPNGAENDDIVSSALNFLY